MKPPRHNPLVREEDRNLTKMPETKSEVIKLLERASGRKVENEPIKQLKPANPFGSLLIAIGILSLVVIFWFLGYCLVMGF